MPNGRKGDVLKNTHIPHLTISMGQEAVHSLAAIKVLAGVSSQGSTKEGFASKFTCSY